MYVPFLRGAVKANVTYATSPGFIFPVAEAITSPFHERCFNDADDEEAMLMSGAFSPYDVHDVDPMFLNPAVNETDFPETSLTLFADIIVNAALAFDAAGVEEADVVLVASDEAVDFFTVMFNVNSPPSNQEYVSDAKRNVSEYVPAVFGA